jgi:hypothetical protein
VAWVTLLVAFGLLLACLSASFVAGRWFLLESETALQTTVRVGRGTVGLRAPDQDTSEAVRFRFPMGRDQILSTDEIAQAYLEVRDTLRQDRVLVHVVALPGSQVALGSATRPRFSFGTQGYRLRLYDFEGRLEITIPPDLPDDIYVEVQGLHGRVLLRENGMYLLWSLPDAMIIIPRKASAEFIPTGGENVVVPIGETATFSAATQSISLEHTTDELVKNPLLLFATQKGVADNWGCYSTSADPNQPRAQYNLYTFEGRRAFEIQRLGENLGYGETGCQQLLGENANGLDVTSYRTLRLRASVNLRWHSLAVCGSRGSECAVMLELSYINEYGNPQRWIHGFYAYEHANPEVPRTCDSCLIPHDRITPENWYTFESANLFSLPEGYRPTRLTQIRFYSSGHAYQAVVGEVSLLAER